MKPFTLEWWCKLLVEVNEMHQTALFYELNTSNVNELKNYIIYRISLKLP